MSKMSILSDVPDGMGYFYGFRDGDSRQINVRLELCARSITGVLVQELWIAYVSGNAIGGSYATLAEAETAAIEWMEAHPDEEA
jgi:hypothetical protein